MGVTTTDPGRLKELEAPTLVPDEAPDSEHPLAQLSHARKSFLLLIFSISGFIDVCNVGGISVAVVQIGADLALGPSQLVWIITAYSLTFAAFLLFAGRLSDLCPATVVFESGFFLLGIFTLVTSFVTYSKYGFLILRGIGGVCGAMTVPSAYHLVVHMYPKHEEQQGKLALLGLSSAIGSILGVVLAGLCMLANYRWFLRVLAIVCILFSIISFLLLPSTPSSYFSENNPVPRWKRMDVVGVLLMTGALVCFILSLTQGPIDGWGSASFIAPFFIAFILGPLFFVREARIPSSSAVLPVSVWQITNMVVSSLAVIYAFSVWTTSQLQYSTYWQEILGWKPIHVAAGLLPQGVVGIVVGGMAQGVPGIINKPRITIPVGAALMMIAEVLQVYSNGGGGMDYWKFCFPAFVLGSGGSVITFFASAINLIQNCPPEMAGVAGAWTQVLPQIGSAVCLAVQAGLQGPNESDWQGSDARGYWFLFALIFVLALQYAIFYKQPAPPQEEHELARMRMKAAGLTLTDEQ